MKSGSFMSAAEAVVMSVDAHVSAIPRPSIRSIVAPSASSRRTMASMTACRISSWSRVALTRAAISRSVRSASAVRARSLRDRSSSSMSLALVMAMAAWLASAPMSDASVSVKASRLVE